MQRHVLALRHVPFEDLGLLAPVLSERGYSIQYLDIGIDPITTTAVREPDLLVVLGGPIGVYETNRYPFLDQEIAALKTRLDLERATLGICLGAQLMARALGAEVRATGKKEIGYGALAITEAGRSSLLREFDETAVLHWHGDTFDVPPGADLLASTREFPHQAFSVGASILALQFHIEADFTRIEQWLIGHAHELSTARIEPQRIRDDADRFGPQLAQAATRAFNRWLEKAEDHDVSSN